MLDWAPTSITSMLALSHLITTGSSIANCGGYLATGSDSGVVNIYDSASLAGIKPNARPQPSKAISSLTTPVDHVTNEA